MWLPERVIRGPRRLAETEIGELNRLFTDAFTDRYRRDGLVGVRVPPLNPAIWRYALRDAGEGAMAWTDERDQLVAFNVAHHSGVEGWMGPLAVRPDRQGLGLGKTIIQKAIQYLAAQQVRVIGLETMPRTVENIGFYSKLGFVPGPLTVTLLGELGPRPARARDRTAWRLSELSPGEQAHWLGRCRRALDRVSPGYDFTREFRLTAELELGDTLALGMPAEVAGFALYHSAPLAEGRPADELRVLKLFAASLEAFDRLVASLEATAAQLRLRRVAIRCQTAYRQAYRYLIERGYRVRWTDLRMWLEDYPEHPVADGAVLFSNWEI